MKTLFVFQIQSFTDVVTNSSSELFVFTGTTGVVSDMLDSNVPDGNMNMMTHNQYRI